MPYQNRVTPTGELIVVPARGTLMGNRGTLHNTAGEIIKTSARKPWIICALEFKDRKQIVMAPGRYTQLFFLDEATALAAGHRPCASCRRTHYTAFTGLFKETHRGTIQSISEIDEKLSQQRKQDHPQVSLSDVPDGAFVSTDSQGKATWLVWENHLYRWSPTGYCEKQVKATNTTLLLITPWSTVQVLSGGYQPTVHPSIDNLVETAPLPKQTAATMSPPIETDETPSLAPPPSRANHGPGFPQYKLKITPRGKALHAYFAAILSATGMDQGHAANLKLFFGNFKGHLDAGRIMKMDNGYQLTDAGMTYFADRFNPGSPQGVDPTLYQTMLQGLKNGGSDWAIL